MGRTAHLSGRPGLTRCSDSSSSTRAQATARRAPDELRDAARERGIDVTFPRGGRRPAGARAAAQTLTCSGWRAATARSQRSPRSRSSRTCRSSASRSGPATTSPATSASTATTRSARSRPSTGEERRIDVGRVGERLFLNNVSLGLYARLVHRREHHRRRREALARLRALALTAAGPPPAAAVHDRRRARARAARARREQRLQPRPALARRARATRRGPAPSVHPARLPAHHLGRAELHELEIGSPLPPAQGRGRRRADGARDAARVPDRAAARYACCCRERQSERIST